MIFKTIKILSVKQELTIIHMINKKLISYNEKNSKAVALLEKKLANKFLSPLFLTKNFKKILFIALR